ncbi:hypothetical protein [Methanosarcina sp.]|uniref:hypothetical protein n=1 Tax=Methanosarcina sp. TaxID=2213 RepID=UPI003BB4A49B
MQIGNRKNIKEKGSNYTTDEFEDDLRIGANETTHYVDDNIITQPYIEGKKRIGELKCECGAAYDDNTTVTFHIFKSIEKWEPREVEKHEGELYMHDERLSTIYICHASIYCEKCKNTCYAYASLDYEDQMTKLIGQIEKNVGMKIYMPCRPIDADEKNLLVTAFSFSESIEGEEEYYLAGDEKFGKRGDELGWRKAWYKFNAKTLLRAGR